jgi:hypothetical protein
MVPTTNIAAVTGASEAEKKFSLGSLYPRLRFIAIGTEANDASSILWPCLEFENFSSITPDVRKAINKSGQEEMTLLRSTLRRLSSNQGMEEPVALLLGKSVPNHNRCVWFQGDLLSFMDNFNIVIQSCEDVAGLKDAMEAIESIIEDALSTDDSTTTHGQSEAMVALDAPPNKCNKTTAVEKPPDQDNAVVEVKSAALNTGSSSYEEATLPHKASIDSLSKVDDVIAPPKESSIKSDTAVQPRKTRESSSKEEEAMALKEPFIESRQKVVPLTAKTRASSLSSRRRPKIAEVARVSMSTALFAEERLQLLEQDSSKADSSTTSSTQTKQTLHSSRSTRKPTKTVTFSLEKHVAPSPLSPKQMQAYQNGIAAASRPTRLGAPANGSSYGQPQQHPTVDVTAEWEGSIGSDSNANDFVYRDEGEFEEGAGDIVNFAQL